MSGVNWSAGFFMFGFNSPEGDKPSISLWFGGMWLQKESVIHDGFINKRKKVKKEKQD